MEETCPKCGTPLITRTIKKELVHGSIDYPVARVCPKCNWTRDLTGAGYMAPAAEEKKEKEKINFNKIITTALAILVLGGIVWAFYSTAPQQEALPPQTIPAPVITATPITTITNTPVPEVTITPTGIKKRVALDRKRGFTPVTSTIKAGDEVVWTNEGIDRLTLISSDGLFEDKILDIGKRISYTFIKPGTYGFHLKENQNLKGTVVVET